jgi:DNA-binding NarL/FixJ family response regulator
MATKTESSGEPEINIFIIEDHAQVRRAIGRFIQQQPDLNLCGVAASAEDALDKLPKCQPPPDIALVDISLPKMDGIALIQILTEQYPDLLCIVLSSFDGVIYAPRALMAGARGYLEKASLNSESISEAIHQVYDGRIYLSEKLKNSLDR